MNILGALKITVKKGIDLKVCDAFSSDPYVVISSGSQVTIFIKLYTQVNVLLMYICWFSIDVKSILANLLDRLYVV